MRKQIMSIAAAAALLTSGAQAFDTNATGDVINSEGTPLTFTQSFDGRTIDPIFVDDDLKGDSLIYPAFNQKDAWGTEIIVRNSRDYAVIAKAVMYAGDDSREVKDFNIYLSANDVCRFTIKDGKVTSIDDSVVVEESKTNNQLHVFASADRPFEVPVDVDFGYVVVYGLFSLQTVTEHNTETTRINGIDYTAKELLFESYRAALDVTRANWNAPDVMVNGAYVGGVDPVRQSPNVNRSDVSAATNAAFGIDVGDVVSSTLLGSVRMFNDEDVTRDLLLNATAVNFFTLVSTMLWGPDEYASMADRRLYVDGNGIVKYDSVGIQADVVSFLKTGAYYTYNNAGDTPDVDNTLLITQPLKRTLVQLGASANASDYWVMRECEEDATRNEMALIMTGRVWDESENNPANGGGGPITSPGNSDVNGYCNELVAVEQPEADTDFADRNGYIHYTMGIGNGVPALVTQMSASKVGADYRINWIDSVVINGNP